MTIQNTLVVDELAGPYSIAHEKSGGIMATRDVTLIDSSSMRLTRTTGTTSPLTAAVTSAEVSDLRTAIQNARYRQFSSSIKTSTADIVIYKITLTNGGAQYIASWAEGAPLSAEMSALVARIVALRDSKLSAPAM